LKGTTFPMTGLKFLMHRVELKVNPLILLPSLPDQRVPNAPCGVERSQCFSASLQKFDQFLMHRVELKAKTKISGHLAGWLVSNAPCGVESALKGTTFPMTGLKFLMHRVELKGK